MIRSFAYKLISCTVPKEIDFPRYNMKMKCSGENMILRGKFHVVSCFPLHFILYHRNLDYILDSVEGGVRILLNGHSSRAHGLAMASNTFYHLFFVGEKGGGERGGKGGTESHTTTKGNGKKG